jgi:KRAB domain-containing zinc finger protein
MTLHLNKRAFKCAECQEHFNGVDDLNKHFAENHSEKIQEHKEAIQKIPHGLQQTYHLLKMPLNNITTQEMSSTTTEPKYLKCNMCQFVAKWPAELQKHAVSHSEERPFICMVCGSTTNRQLH